MSFDSLYAHGFARVAACTADVFLADPVRNAGSVVDVSRRLSELGRRGGGVPGAGPHRVRRRGPARAGRGPRRRPRRARRDRRGECRTVAGDHRRAHRCGRDRAVQLRRGHPPRPGPRSGAQGSPAQLPGVLRAAPVRLRPGRHGSEILVAGRPAPFGTDLLFEATDVPGLTIGVEICEDLFVPVPPSSGLALAGATVLVNLSGSPITIGRADTRSLLCRTQSMRCLSAYLYAAAGQGESTTDLSWDGQTSIFENGRELAQGARFEVDPQLTIADVDLDLLRSGAGPAEHVRGQPAGRHSGCGLPDRGVHPRSARRRSGPAPGGGAVPVRTGRSRPARAGLLRGVQHPGRRTGPATPRHRHRQGGDRGLRRSGLDARADRRRPGHGSAGPAADQHPRLHNARLRDRQTPPRPMPGG